MITGGVTVAAERPRDRGCHRERDRPLGRFVRCLMYGGGGVRGASTRIRARSRDDTLRSLGELKCQEGEEQRTAEIKNPLLAGVLVKPFEVEGCRLDHHE